MVCRLVAPQALRIDRVRHGTPSGPSREWHEHGTAELEALLQAASLEDFVVANGGRGPREVALDVLSHARWL